MRNTISSKLQCAKCDAELEIVLEPKPEVTAHSAFEVTFLVKVQPCRPCQYQAEGALRFLQQLVAINEQQAKAVADKVDK